jgi:hypothetical protein
MGTVNHHFFDGMCNYLRRPDVLFVGFFLFRIDITILVFFLCGHFSKCGGFQPLAPKLCTLGG